MMKDKVLTVKDAVHKIQLYLLEGIKRENQLIAAGSLVSRNDYQDVVTERTIANMCGYPLCSNSLPAERPWKGRYRVSLREHKVYDLQETYMYCSSGCLINSRAFAASLQEERISNLNPAKLNDVLKLFDGLSLDSDVNMGKSGDLGLCGLKIKEKPDTTAGDVSLEQWIGPSNAIDGYVPRRDQNLEAKKLNDIKKRERREQIESKHRQVEPNVAHLLSYDMDFTSTIITQDEYTISKAVHPVKAKEQKGKGSTKEVNRQGNPIRNPIAPSTNTQETRSRNSNKSKNASETDVKVSVLEDTTATRQETSKEAKELHLRKESAVDTLKSSLKTSDSKKANHVVTWADKKTDADGQNHECKELKDREGARLTHHLADEEVGQGLYRFASAEACTRALSEAAASRKSEASDAVYDAGVLIMPPPHGENEVKYDGNGDVTDTDPLQLKWPPKPGLSTSAMLDSEDSWYDSLPEGFNLALSPFSTMFMALFAWMSSSSLAFIYGKGEIFHEDFLSVNGREYPHQVILPDGRSSEIKRTLAGCLGRALPGLVAELRLPIPISILEQGLGRLLDTMSFIDPLPAFMMKQWQVIDLLFLNALSVNRIPALTPYVVGRRILLPKVLEGAQISIEEFEVLMDLMIPLGRVPQFSTQCGG